jgi:sulfopropanediol 3-dehydrogenase
VQYLKRASEDETKTAAVREQVRDILDSVHRDGDAALRKFTAQFDGIEQSNPLLTDEERSEALSRLRNDEQRIIDHNHEHIQNFAERQMESISSFEEEFSDGISLGQTIQPIETIGAYVPGGRYPLLSSALMTITPPVVAGVKEVVMVTPPSTEELPHPATIYAAEVAGVDDIYVAGGAQAVAALAYGTETVPSVDKVVGPGNAYTVEAKRQVFGEVGIDMLAGPSEILVLADETADAELVACDLIAQAEHDTDARPLLVSTDKNLSKSVINEVENQLADLSTAEVAGKAWETKGEAVVCENIDEAVTVTNEYAPEHLEVHTADPRALVDDLHNYGSLFLGEPSAVVYSDKCVGTNHVLPTDAAARYTSGFSVFDCIKTPTYQELSSEGAEKVRPWATSQSQQERLEGHAKSAYLRGPEATLENYEDAEFDL